MTLGLFRTYAVVGIEAASGFKLKIEQYPYRMIVP